MKNILIVDMQNGFINDNNRQIIEKINKYLENNKFDNVIYTRYRNYNDSPFVKILDWRAMTTLEEQEFCVNFLKDAMVIQKVGYGVRQEDILNLKELDIDEIEVCGTDTDACVLAIAFLLFDNNIKPIILKDLCASSSSNIEMHNMAIKVMERQFGSKNVINTNE